MMRGKHLKDCWLFISYPMTFQHIHTIAYYSRLYLSILYPNPDCSHLAQSELLTSGSRSCKR